MVLEKSGGSRGVWRFYRRVAVLERTRVEVLEESGGSRGD